MRFIRSGLKVFPTSRKLMGKGSSTCDLVIVEMRLIPPPSKPEKKEIKN